LNPDPKQISTYSHRTVKVPSTYLHANPKF